MRIINLIGYYAVVVIEGLIEAGKLNFSVKIYSNIKRLFSPISVQIKSDRHLFGAGPAQNSTLFRIPFYSGASA